MYFTAKVIVFLAAADVFKSFQLIIQQFAEIRENRINTEKKKKGIFLNKKRR